MNIKINIMMYVSSKMSGKLLLQGMMLIVKSAVLRGKGQRAKLL